MTNSDIDRSPPLPEITDLSRPFWDGLARGVLSFQRCRACDHAWLPARSECPLCLAADWQREDAGNDATLVSWVVYHHAYHPAFADRLPYAVAVVALAEGPRLIAGLVADTRDLKIDQPLKLRVEAEGGIAVARFAPAAPA